MKQNSGVHWLCSLAGQRASEISLSLPRAAGAAGIRCDADFGWIRSSEVTIVVEQILLKSFWFGQSQNDFTRFYQVWVGVRFGPGLVLV